MLRTYDPYVLRSDRGYRIQPLNLSAVIDRRYSCAKIQPR